MHLLTITSENCVPPLRAVTSFGLEFRFYAAHRGQVFLERWSNQLTREKLEALCEPYLDTLDTILVAEALERKLTRVAKEIERKRQYHGMKLDQGVLAYTLKPFTACSL